MPDLKSVEAGQTFIAFSNSWCITSLSFAAITRGIFSPTQCQQVQCGKITAYYQQMVKDDSDQALTTQMTHGTHSEAVVMIAGIVRRR